MTQLRPVAAEGYRLALLGACFALCVLVSDSHLMATTPSAEDAEGMEVAPPLPTLQASELSQRLTASAFHDIRRLASVLSRVNLDSRREDLLDYIRPNRARFLKAYAVISWLSGKHNHGELVVNASRALAEGRSQREQIDTVRKPRQQGYDYIGDATYLSANRCMCVCVCVCE